MGESRNELIAWLNDLLQLNYTKVRASVVPCLLMEISKLTMFGDFGFSSNALPPTI